MEKRKETAAGERRRQEREATAVVARIDAQGAPMFELRSGKFTARSQCDVSSHEHAAL